MNNEPADRSNHSGRPTSRTDRPDSLRPDTPLELVIVVAIADNGVIGADGDLPWYIPEDLRFFKQQTIGHPVIMGRVTYESIVNRLGHPLPDRTSIVLTRSDPARIVSGIATSDDRRATESTGDDVIVVSDIEAAIEAAERAAQTQHGGVERAMIVGGASIYEQFLPVTERLIVTEVHDDPDGDTYFPSWASEQWEEVDRDDREGYSFVEYVRTDPQSAEN